MCEQLDRPVMHHLPIRIRYAMHDVAGSTSPTMRWQAPQVICCRFVHACGFTVRCCYAGIHSNLQRLPSHSATWLDLPESRGRVGCYVFCTHSQSVLSQDTAVCAVRQFTCDFPIPVPRGITRLQTRFQFPMPRG